MANESKKAIKLFICYAREDEGFLKDLEKHLRPLQRQGLIEPWHDRAINPGEEWARVIDKHLNAAQIILLLISPDFMASEYCYSVEMKRAMERHELGEACVIPIILRPTHWEGTLFGHLQVLPTDAKPVKSAHWHDPDEAFYDVTSGIRIEAEKKMLLLAHPTPIPERNFDYTLQAMINKIPKNFQNLSENEIGYIHDALSNCAHIIDDWVYYTKDKWRTVSDSQLAWRPLRGRWSGWDDVYQDCYPTDKSDPFYPATRLALGRTALRFEQAKKYGSAASAVVSFLRDLDSLERCIEILSQALEMIPQTPAEKTPSQESQTQVAPSTANDINAAKVTLKWPWQRKRK